MHGQKFYQELKAAEKAPDLQAKFNQTVIGRFQFGTRQDRKTIIAVPMRSLEATTTLKHFNEHVETGMGVISARKMIQAMISSIDKGVVAITKDVNEGSETITASLKQTPAQEYEFHIPTDKAVEFAETISAFIAQRHDHAGDDLTQSYLEQLSIKIKSCADEAMIDQKRQSTMRLVKSPKKTTPTQ